MWNVGMKNKKGVAILKDGDAFLTEFVQRSFGPEGRLYFTNMGFAQKEHTDSRLADTAADGVGKFVLQNSLLERQFCPLRTAGLFQLAFQSGRVDADTHGG